MRRLFKTKKGLALLATLVVVAAAAVGAYAYFTSSGSGSGSAIAGSPAGSVNITLTVGLTAGIVPGSSEPVSFSATNAGPTEGIVRTITFGSVTDPTDTSTGGACSTYLTTYGTGGSSDFSMAAVNETSPGTLVPTTGTTPLGSTSLVWKNNDTQDQTPCAGQNLQLNVNWS